MRVYPRASGGTCATGLLGSGLHGLSPRERGNHRCFGEPPGCARSIPARAGEPPTDGRGPSAQWVYPRASGGTSPSRSPRHSSKGLSPRERGNPVIRTRFPTGTGSIPARAGEPRRSARSLALPAVYPRASGGTPLIVGVGAVRAGLSPRERGNPPLLRDCYMGARSIPARAGEPSLDPSQRRGDRDTGLSPRERGNPAAQRIGGTSRRIHGLSPRERGNRLGAYRRPRATFDTGLSPRERGNLMVTGGGHRQAVGVYPRASGGTMMPTLSSPRRGSVGSIPARAGEPECAKILRSRLDEVYPRASGGTSPWRRGHRRICDREVYPRASGGTFQRAPLHSRLG